MNLKEFNDFREKMNEKILKNGTLNTKRFFNLDGSVYKDGEIPTKYKEMMGLVASMVLRCEGCIAYHIKRCLEEGVTDKEFYEVFDIALIVGGSIVIPHLREAVAFLEEAKKEIKGEKMKTEIIKLDPLNIDESKLRIASEEIKKGHLVVFPTETVYGLGANGLNENAVKKIYKAKGRPSDNPLILHIDKLEKIREFAYISNEMLEKIKIFVPGPITFVLNKKNNVPDIVSANRPTVAVRIPAHPIANKLIEMSGVPIAAPSANLSGKPSPTIAEHVIEDMLGRVDIIIDGGDVNFGLESTVIDLTEKIPTLLRPGPITPEKLIEVFGKINIPDFIYGKGKVDIAKAPGMKYRHYAPDKKTILVEFSEKRIQKIKENIKQFKKPLLVLFEEDKKYFNEYDIIISGNKNDYYRIAVNLFSILRNADKTNNDVIIIEGVEDKGLGISIMNRLRKAASEIWGE
ncbi:L-threonylcarbamoyladenylate synthase [Marinitoga aeolica]|uniref:L-threonylcarbamoyladenylate synthase n=1 Tax=Marinitoga aeolica TaxID=2809031 RepID=A0ABY8PS66_9BACT|nr:L-threonylcarbamoyladenylate synthase [Marinitoga aeolica]WGS65482.1 threonylcarbamoyl-AMP synthase [Marinitoga aeolica]